VTILLGIFDVGHTSVLCVANCPEVMNTRRSVTATLIKRNRVPPHSVSSGPRESSCVHRCGSVPWSPYCCVTAGYWVHLKKKDLGIYTHWPSYRRKAGMRSSGGCPREVGHLYCVLWCLWRRRKWRKSMTSERVSLEGGGLILGTIIRSEYFRDSQ
jgi:hypothetical protein